MSSSIDDLARDRLWTAAKALAAAPADTPRHDALLARYYRVAAPLLEERERLMDGLAFADARIDDERAKRGVGFGLDDHEPADAAYQQGVDRWRDWLLRYRNIEDALRKSAECAGIQL